MNTPGELDPLAPTSARPRPTSLRAWSIVFAAAVAMSVSVLPLSVLTFGVLMKPIALDFGWTRVQMSSALTLHLVASMPFAVVAGRIVDRHGARAVALPCFILHGLCLFSFALMTGELWQYYLAYTLAALFGAGTSAVVITKLISSAFVQQRGLALGLTLCGQGLGGALAPWLAESLASSHGWRAAFVCLGALSAMIGALATLVMTRVQLDRFTSSPCADARQFAAARSTAAFWVLLLGFSQIGFCFAAVTIHGAPSLTDRGMDSMSAAAVISTLGVSVMVGRAAMAFALDRVWVPGLAAALLLTTVSGMALWAHAPIGGFTFLGAFLIGVSSGAEVDVLAFLVARCFGTSLYGRIYGWCYGGYLLGAAMGPIAAAAIHERYQSYFVGYAPYAALLVITAAALVTLLPRPLSYVARQQPSIAARINR